MVTMGIARPASGISMCPRHLTVHTILDLATPHQVCDPYCTCTLQADGPGPDPWLLISPVTMPRRLPQTNLLICREGKEITANGSELCACLVLATLLILSSIPPNMGGMESTQHQVSVEGMACRSTLCPVPETQ